jgi:4'-phosphopantetheinyl transferase
MPILNKDISIHNNVKLWRITESWTELIDLFEKDAEINTIIQNFKSESKKKQFLASRLLLKLEFGNWKTLSNPNGKPYPIDNPSEISITHDRGIVGLIKSMHPCGIDMQEITAKVIRVKSKFVNENDFYSTSEKEKDLTLLWCAKETLYKINGDPNIFFKEHMIIEESDEENMLIGKIVHPQYRKDYKLKVHFIENYCLVYTFSNT